MVVVVVLVLVLLLERVWDTAACGRGRVGEPRTAACIGSVDLTVCHLQMDWELVSGVKMGRGRSQRWNEGKNDGEGDGQGHAPRGTDCAFDREFTGLGRHDDAVISVGAPKSLF